MGGGEKKEGKSFKDSIFVAMQVDNYLLVRHN